MKKKIIKIILVILWMTLIFCFSNQKSDDSSKVSDGVIKNTIGRVFNISDDNISQFVKPVRKAAHFTIYLILGLLVLNCFSIFDKKTIIISILICLLYAISDEIHQIFISGRSAEILDIIIDTLGASLGIFIRKKAARK